MPKANRTCHTCGKSYYYCNTCSGKKMDPTIYTLCDSERCKNIFTILSDYYWKKSSIEESKALLKEQGVSRQEEFLPSIREQVDTIMSYHEEPAFKKRNKKKEMDIELKEEVIEEPALDPEVSLNFDGISDL